MFVSTALLHELHHPMLAELVMLKFNVPSYLDIAWSMADHIATRKSTQISTSTNRNARTDRLIVNGSQQRVNVYSKPVTYGAMNNQKQAELCVLYIRVSTTRQADKGVSLRAQKERGKLHAQYQNFLLPKSHIFHRTWGQCQNSTVVKTCW